MRSAKTAARTLTMANAATVRNGKRRIPRRRREAERERLYIYKGKNTEKWTEKTRLSIQAGKTSGRLLKLSHTSIV